MSSDSNKQIAKNTLLLYMRTAITMVIALYTSRVVLLQLGIYDYGIYNVVGGIVGLLASLSTTLSGATQRYITYEIGKGDNNHLCKIFSVSFRIHSYMALIVLILAETVGLWYVNFKMNIPEGRELAANFVFQTSIISFLVDIITLPYNSAVIAYERFRFYAIAFIIQSVIKLCLVLALAICPFDKLIVYGCAELFVSLIIKLSFILYSRREFTCCKLIKFDDKSLYLELLRFTGWNFFGTASSIVYSQGSNLLLNHFLGVLLNAAMGVTQQVLNAVTSFVSNFTVAVNPQITKNFACGNYSRTNDLVFLSSKISSYLLLIISFPIIVNLHYILNIWLVKVPEYTEIFISMALLSSFLSAFNIPFNCLIFATGKIKVYQICCVMVNVSSVFILYFLFKEKFHPAALYFLGVFQSIIKMTVMLYLANKATGFPILKFLYSIYMKGILFTIPIVIILVVKSTVCYNMNFSRFILESIIFITFICIIIYFIGFNHNERCNVNMSIKNSFSIIRRVL